MASVEMQDYMHYMGILMSGEVKDFEELSALDDDFPNGCDTYLQSQWIMHAISSGSLTSVQWMLEQQVELLFCENDGYTVIHAVLDRDDEHKYTILEALLNAGADVNAKGINNWTPAHMAAVRNDVQSLKMLVEHGADLTIKTAIDNYATPLEEALILSRFVDCQAAIEYLQSVK